MGYKLSPLRWITGTCYNASFVCICSLPKCKQVSNGSFYFDSITSFLCLLAALTCLTTLEQIRHFIESWLLQKQKSVLKVKHQNAKCQDDQDKRFERQCLDVGLVLLCNWRRGMIYSDILFGTLPEIKSTWLLHVGLPNSCNILWFNCSTSSHLLC